jgi:hypothetical protein
METMDKMDRNRSKQFGLVHNEKPTSARTNEKALKVGVLRRMIF